MTLDIAYIIQANCLLIAATKAYDLTLNFSSFTIMFSLPDDQALLLNVLKEKTASSINLLSYHKA